MLSTSPRAALGEAVTGYAFRSAARGRIMTAVRHPVSGASASRVGARERVLAAAYELFSRRGTRDVGIDTIVRRSGVAKMSLYHHFHSKQNLVAAFLERRER